MKENIKILEAFKALLETDYTFYCYYGGRGGGKTENIALILVLMAMRKKTRFLCIRETYRTIRDSVRQSILDAISTFEVDDLFQTSINKIIFKPNKSEFIFAGMGDNFSHRIKSIKGVNVTWVEEASDISERSWLTLLPSVLRTPNAKIIVSFNPFSEDDIVYKQFISGTPPYNSYIKKINYDDNPFFLDTPLDEQRKHQLETLPFALYDHIWNGEILKHIANALFDENTIRNIYITDVDYKDITAIVISCDPATTNKDHSNEYGIIALGRLKDGNIIALKDYSNVMSPNEFTNIVLRAVNEWEKVCENVKVVVETNQGGDFIKHTILIKNPLIQVKEVSAGVDKVKRVLPISNLCAIGRVKLDKSFDFSKLVKQMKLITQSGYAGAKGESPDRLDAFVWGIYYLAELKNFDTRESYYKSEYFYEDNAYSFVDYDNVVFGYIDSVGYYFIELSILSNADTYKKILITDSLFFDNMQEAKEYLSNKEYIFLPNNELTLSLNINCNTYDLIQDINELISANYHLFCENKLMISKDMPTRKMGIVAGQLVLLSLLEYKRDNVETLKPFVLICNYALNHVEYFN